MQVFCWTGLISFWIFVGSSYCPMNVKAEEGEHVSTFDIPLIRVCSESVLKSFTGRQLHGDHGSKSEIQGDKVIWQAPSYWLSSNETSNFSLIIGEPQCMFANYQILRREDDLEKDYNASMVHFYANGYFRNDLDIYAPDEICIESVSQRSSREFRLIKLKLCKPDCGMGKKRPCIKKCCPLDKIFEISRKPVCTTLSPESLPFMPTFYDDYYTQSKIYNASSVISSIYHDNFGLKKPKTLMPHFIINYPKIFRDSCKDKVVLALPTSETSAQVLTMKTGKEMHSSMFRIRTDGAIMYKTLENKCESMSMNLDTFCIDGVSGISHPTDLNVPFNNTEDEYIIFQCQVIEKDPYLDLISCHVLQGSAHLIGVTLKDKALNTPYCVLLGVLVHFFMMSTFTWCSVMTFDLFITFRIYASNDCSYHAVPGYGVRSCWIKEDSLGEYLYYPAGFLLCVNISLFTATCVKLCMYGRRTTVRAQKNNEAFGECFSRFSKLFCVMGISWIFEILSWYIDGLGFHWYWNILDLFNILRAVAVFAIYVCKNDIIKQLEDTYPTLKPYMGYMWLYMAKAEMSIIHPWFLEFVICFCYKGIYRPVGRLFLRKCSDEISVESTVLSAIPNSPAIGMKVVNTSCESRGNNRRKKVKDADACEL